MPTISYAILCGCLISVAIAWCCALVVEEPRYNEHGEFVQETLIGPYIYIERLSPESDAVQASTKFNDQFGFPFVSFQSEWTITTDAFEIGSLVSDYELRGGIWRLRSGPSYCNFRAIPLMPVWLGLILNSVTCAIPLFLLCATYRYLRIRRCHNKGVCCNCGYSQKESSGVLCTECGYAPDKWTRLYPRSLVLFAVLLLLGLPFLAIYAYDCSLKYPPLYTAVVRDDIDMVRELLARGADPNEATDDDSSPCMNTGMTDVTPLIAATRRNNIKIIQELIDAQTDLSTTTWGMTALTYAVEQDNIQSAKILYAAGAEINGVSGQMASPLDMAVEKGHLNVVIWLLEQGANSNLPTWDNMTPLFRVALYAATNNDSIEITKLLIQNGADVNAINSIGDSVTIYFTRYHDLDELRLVLDAGADPNYIRPIGSPEFLTALHYAVKRDQVEAVRILLAAGADPDLKSRGGPSARELAASLELEEIISTIDEH